MYKGQSILAIICARSGSKGLPGKNKMLLNGKPVIQWSGLAAQNSKLIDDTIISTDCEELMSLVKETGVRAPFIRPAELSDDDSSIDDVLLHAIKWLKENEDKTYDVVLLLQATSPLRTTEHIDQSIEVFIKEKQSDIDTLISVYEVPKKMGWLLQEKTDGSIDFCLSSKRRGLRRQDQPSFYLPNGAIYLATVKGFDGSFFSDRIIPFVMNLEESVDIDHIEDFEKATEQMQGSPKC